jgi:hypothetical protein
MLTRLILVIVGSVLFGLGLVGCQTGTEPGTCRPCGDGAIVCTATVADCIADNGGSCTTKLGATQAATLTLNANGSYTETSAAGAQDGTWTQNGDAIALNNSAAIGVTSLLSVYENGAVCPYAAVSQ